MDGAYPSRESGPWRIPVPGPVGTPGSAPVQPSPAARRYNAGMEIMLNGKRHPIQVDMTVAQLLAQTDLAQRKVAVEVNREIVPRSRHGEHRLADGDRVEIVNAIGGG